MGKFKELCLQHRGYLIEGSAEIIHWGGGAGVVKMDSFFIPADELTHNRIKDGINDGGFGCESITSASITIFKSYGDTPYLQQNRDLYVDMKQCFKGKRGI